MAQHTSWTAEADFNSRYVWRGIAYSKGPVFQPALWVTHRGSTASVWSNMVLNNEPRRGRFDQVFFTLSHEFQPAGFRLEPAFQGYWWQGLEGEPNARTVELSAKLSRRLRPVDFVTSGTVDIGSYRGSLIGDAGIEWKRSARQWQFESSATAAWANRRFNRTYIGTDLAALNYVQFTVSAMRKSARGWYLRPHAEFVTIASSTIRRALDSRGYATGGLAVGREF